MESGDHAFMPLHGPDSAVGLRNATVLTASDLERQAGALASRMQTSSALLCLCGDRFHIAVTLLAALHLDRPCVMPHDHSSETLRRLRARYPGAAAVADRSRAAELDALAVDDPAAGNEPEAAAHAATFSGDRRAAHVFTSGSTGEPRVHEKPWAAMAGSGRDLARRFDIVPGTSVVATVPGQHVFGLEASLMLPLASGSALYAGQPLLPADIADALARVPRPRILVSTPLQLSRLLASTIAVPEIDRIISATAPLSTSLAQQLESRTGAPVFEMYGSTETGVVATRRTVQTERWHAMDTVTVRPVNAGCRVVSRYLPTPVDLEDRIEPGPDDTFRLIGRGEDLVKIAGKRGSLADITAKLLAVAGVEDAAVYAPPGDANTVRRLAAFVVAPGVSADAIRAPLRERVDPAFLPRPIVHVEALPRGSTGKLPRAELQRLYETWLAQRAEVSR